MEIQDILALVQAVADNGLTELKVDDGNVKLSLKKEHPVVNVVAGNTGAGSAGGGMQVAGVQMPDFGSFGAAGAPVALWQILARQRKRLRSILIKSWFPRW